MNTHLTASYATKGPDRQILLFSITYGFIFLNFPFGLWSIFKRYSLEKRNLSENFENVKQDQFYNFTVDNICKIFLDLNFVIKFVFYLAGARFRKKFCFLFRLVYLGKHNYEKHSLKT